MWQLNSIARCTGWILLYLLFEGAILANEPEWPQWLGPQRDGVYRGAELNPEFAKDGPPAMWQRPVGEGFSSPVVRDDRVILFHRVDNMETVECLVAQTGELVWEYAYETHYVDSFGFDEGPRATPLIHGDTVYTFGAEGILQALDFKTGKRLWQVETEMDFAPPKGFFGRAGSPIVEGNSLIINVGAGDGSGIVAFHKDQRNVLWKATDDEASYSSPTAATIDGKRYVFFYNRAGLVSLNPTNGHVFFEYPWRSSMNASVNAATPLVIGDLIFLSTSYGKGATVIQFDESDPKPLWAKDGVLSNHYATSVHHDGFLYGFDGRQEYGCILRCVELRTGDIRWSKTGLKAGTVLLAGDHLWILTENGQLMTAPATPSGFNPVSTSQILGFNTRAYPALAKGYMYARDKKQLVCVKLIR